MPSACSSRSSRELATKSTTPEVHRLALARRHRPAHRLLGPLRVAAALPGDGAREGGRVAGGLARQRRVHAALQVHGRGRADVRARRHPRHVGRHHDEHAGRGRARSGRRDVGEDRHLRDEHPLDHGAHARLESARGVELDHQRLVPLALGLVHRGDQSLGRDRRDGAVDAQDQDASRLLRLRQALLPARFLEPALRRLCAGRGDEQEARRGGHDQQDAERAEHHRRQRCVAPARAAQRRAPPARRSGRCGEHSS